MVVGGELVQGGRPVAFYSKKLAPTESRYHVTDRELMGVYLGCMKWHHYLLAMYVMFTLIMNL